MRKADKKINIPLCVATVLLCLTMFSTYMTSGLYARYTASASGGDSARVAAFVFDVNDTNGQFLDVSSVNEPGKRETFQFTVRNNNGTRTSEVTEKYQVIVERRGSLPLTVTVTEGSTEVVKLTEMQEKAESAERTFQAGQSGTHTYAVTVAWPASQNDLQYANAGLAEIVLRVSAEQVD